jgi:hypothetical protein
MHVKARLHLKYCTVLVNLLTCMIFCIVYSFSFGIDVVFVCSFS